MNKHVYYEAEISIYFNNQSSKKFLENKCNFYSPSFIEKTNIFLEKRIFKVKLASILYFSTPGLTTNIFTEATFIPLSINSVFQCLDNSICGIELGPFLVECVLKLQRPFFFLVSSHTMAFHCIISYKPPLPPKEETTQTQNRIQGSINLQGGWNCTRPKERVVKD